MSLILLVDDDEVLARVLTRVLRAQGHQVVRAETVAAGLTQAAEHKPNLALIDLCLPDGSGTELAARLRLAHDDLAMILMTAYPLRLREQPERTADFARVLVKPLDLTELRQSIDAVTSVCKINN